MRNLTHLIATGLMLAIATPAAAQSRNPQIDYPGFERLTRDVSGLRATRLLDFGAFQTMAARPGALVLDARSRDAFRRGHLRGAVNLPFTDFTDKALAKVIGPDRGRPILIYCNNNFSNNKAPVPMKSRPLALNIQTFINLVGYGYGNVWELDEVIDFNDPKVKWVKG